MKVYYAVIFLAVLITDYVGAKDKDGNTKVPEKYLITNNSVGYFKIGGNWMEIAEKEYKYDFVEGYGICIDGCCSGGYGLGKQIVIEKDGNKMIDSLHLIIVTQRVEENKVIDKNDKSIFFVESDNCPGWYYKDKIDTIMVISDLFKTKEGIKVGSRLGEIKKKFNNLEIYADWLEEDPNALYAETPHYSNLKFIVDSSGFIRGLDNLESFKRLNFTDFKSNTQIIRIVITRDVVKSVIQK